MDHPTTSLNSFFVEPRSGKFLLMDVISKSFLRRAGRDDLRPGYLIGHIDKVLCGLVTS
jgi:hypothetical protein